MHGTTMKILLYSLPFNMSST